MTEKKDYVSLNRYKKQNEIEIIDFAPLSDYEKKELFDSEDIIKTVKTLYDNKFNDSSIKGKTVQLKKIAFGGTSECYRSNDNMFIYKIFAPKIYGGSFGKHIFKKGEYTITFPCWPNDDAIENGKKEFRLRLESFINQKRTVDSQIKKINADNKNSNIFSRIELCYTSLGLAYKDACYNGQSLSEKCGQVNTEEGLQLFLNVAEHIKNMHENGFFHGDIKPDNFLLINTDNGYIVQNIDFDTNMPFKDVNNAFTEKRLYTTSTFYDKDYVKNLYYSKESEKTKWTSLDVKALVKVLICILDKNTDKYYEMDSYRLIEWYYIFKTQIPNIIGEGKEKTHFQKLFVCEQLKKLIYSCSERAENPCCDVETLINKVKEFLGLYQYYQGELPDKNTESVVKCSLLGLSYLPEKVREELLKKVEGVDGFITAKKILEKNLFGDGLQSDLDNLEYYKIDRDLLPHIKIENEEISYIENRSPLFIAIEKAGKNLFITANGGIGKTTSLKSFLYDCVLEKHNKKCLYIDLKMLRDNISIKGYIEGTYGIGIKSLGCKDLILLLDGANEAYDRQIKSETDEDCKLVKECKDLIKDGIKVVITSRTDKITLHNGNNIEESDKKDFDIKDMTYCAFESLTDEQTDKYLSAESIQKDMPIYNLLKNNRMLSAYVKTKTAGATIDKNTTASELLEKFFYRYVKECWANRKSEDDDKENARCRVEEFYKIITDCASLKEITFYKGDPAKAYLDLFDSLGLFYKTKTERGHIAYIWANEIYQEYFAACDLFNILTCLKGDKKIDCDKDSLKDKDDKKIYCDKERLVKEFYFSRVQLRSRLGFPFLKGLLCQMRTEENSALDREFNEIAMLILKFDLSTYSSLNFSEADEMSHYWNTIKLCSEMWIRSNQESVKKESVNHVAKGDLNIVKNKYYDYADKIKDYAYKIAEESHAKFGLSSKYHDDVEVDIVCEYISQFASRNILKLAADEFFLKFFLLCGYGVPDYLKQIPYSSFHFCPYIEEVIIPDTIERIRSFAFFGCKNLKSIAIPYSVTEIGSRVFNNCSSLQSITVDEDNPNYSSIGGILYNKDKTEIISIPQALNGDIILPKTLTTLIGNNNELVFYKNSSITGLTIPNGITRIGDSTFIDCTSLISIVIPNTVESIGEYAFANCISLKSIKIPSGVTIIDEGTFGGCSSLNEVIIPNSVTYIEKDAFFGCDNLKTVRYEGTIEQWKTAIKDNVFNKNTVIYCQDGVIKNN